MQTRYWLAGAGAAALVAAGAFAASPIVHGQTGRQTSDDARASASARASAEARASAHDLEGVSQDISDAVHEALQEAGVHRAGKIDVDVQHAVDTAMRMAHDVIREIDVDLDVQRAVDEAMREAHDVIRDLDVDVIVDDAMQGLSGLSTLGGQPRLGVSTRDVSADEAKAAGLPGITGAYVNDVSADSAAAKAGLQAKDVIVSIDGETVRSARHLARLISETPEGRALQIGYVRGTAKNTVTVTPEVRPFSFNFKGDGGEGPIVRRFERRGPDVRERLDRGDRDKFEFFAPRGPDGQEFFFRRGPEGGARIWVGRGRLGIVAQPLSDQLAAYFGVKSGLLVTSVNENTPAAKAGLKAGDVVTAVNGKPVKDTGDVIDHLQGVEGGKTVPVEITRDKKSQTLSVTLETPSNTSRDRPVIRKSRFTA